MTDDQIEYYATQVVDCGSALDLAGIAHNLMLSASLLKDDDLLSCYRTVRDKALVLSGVGILSADVADLVIASAAECAPGVANDE